MGSRRTEALLLALVACAEPPPPRLAAPTALTATWRAGDVELRWRPPPTAPAGYWIEMATPGTDFVALGVAAPDTWRFVHPDVAPETTFLYRVRAFFADSWAVDATGFVVERSVDGGPFAVLAVLPPDDTSFRTPPEPGARYRVRAYIDGPSTGVVSVTSP